MFSRCVLVLYMFRHYVFSFAAIKSRSENWPEAQCVVFQPFISIVVPARNEERVIGRLLQRLTELNYPQSKLEVIVLDDQSSDQTWKIAEYYASKHPFLIKVIHREVGGFGKADVLNEGLRYANGEIVGFVDADYVPERDILKKVAPCFLDDSVGIVQVRIFVLNGRRSWVSKVVMLERLGGYRVNQRARELFGLVPQFAGTAGFVRRSALLKLGGFDPNTLAEDTDLTFCALLAGFRTSYLDQAESGEEAVEDRRAYWRQRKRWAKGHMQCAFKHIWPLLKSEKVPLKQKIDGLLLLNLYFLPMLVLLSWMLLLAVLVFGLPTWIPYEIAFVSGIFFFLHGNLAPFVEVMAGAVCDKRWKLISFTWLLVFSYIVNMVICWVAFFDLLACKITGRNPNHWHKTVHNGA